MSSSSAKQTGIRAFLTPSRPPRQLTDAEVVRIAVTQLNNTIFKNIIKANPPPPKKLGRPFKRAADPLPLTPPPKLPCAATSEAPTHTDWVEKGLLETIHEAVRHTSVAGMPKFSAAVKKLKRDHPMRFVASKHVPGQFDKLNESTVRGWYVKGTVDLTDAMLRSRERGSAYKPGPGRGGARSAVCSEARHEIDASILAVRGAGA